MFSGETVDCACSVLPGTHPPFVLGGVVFFFSFWLCRVFVAVHELSRAAASGDSSPAAVHRLPAAASLVVFRLSSCGA